MNLKKIGLSITALFILTGSLAACGTNSPAVTSPKTTNVSKTEEPDEYPIKITHAFGETVIEKKPERIVTISWGNQDVPLALGIVPVGVSKANFGAVDENGLLPWTADAYKKLGQENPIVFDDTDGLDYEAISDAAPDVILAAYSGITKEDYDLLTQIAPVIAYPNYAWQTYWREQTVMNAKGMGKEKEANQLISEIESLISTKTSQYESLKDKTAAFFYFNTSDLGVFYIYLPTDPRGSYLMDLGLNFPESVINLAENKSAFTVTISAENIDVLDDIDIIITYGDGSVLETLQSDTLVGQIPAVKNGSVVLMDATTALTASCTPSVLSIPDTIDEYLGLLNEAAKKVK